MSDSRQSIVNVLSLASPQVIALVGAGGKTTCMFGLAGELAEAGFKVLTTTTTKIFRPEGRQSVHVVFSTEIQALIKVAREKLTYANHVTFAKDFAEDQNKLIGFAPTEIEALWRTALFDFIIVEADGAAQRSVKAPATYEPVIPECTSTCIVMMGLDAIGHAIGSQKVFRQRLVADLTGLTLADRLDAHAMAALMMHPQGYLSRIPVGCRKRLILNKADREADNEAAAAIAKFISAAETAEWDAVFAASLLRKRIRKMLL